LEKTLGLEIGCAEGLSTLWFLQNVLTHPSAVIYCIDPRPSSHFNENTQLYRYKIHLLRQRSQVALRDRIFLPGVFSFAYVDGSRVAADVLEDAVLVFRLIKLGGVVIFNEYAGDSDHSAARRSQAGIDAFLQAFEGQYQLLHKGDQVILAKSGTSDVGEQASQEPRAAVEYPSQGEKVQTTAAVPGTTVQAFNGDAVPTRGSTEPSQFAVMASAPVPKLDNGKGAFATGRYRILFAEMGHSPEEIRTKVEGAFRQLFHGDLQTQALYIPAGTNVNGPLAYIADIQHADVRSEGMARGMMIAVQLDKKEEFDALWNWSMTYMYHDNPEHPRTATSPGT
jgi:hypothetical protein